MELVVKRLTARTKKFFLLLLAFPIILGALGWFLPVGKTGSDAPAEAEISLGSYENPNLNDPKQVIVLLSNLPFYQENLPDVLTKHREEIMRDLSVTPVTETNIQISYKNHPKEESIQMVNSIADAFMKLDKRGFEQKQTIMKESIDRLKNEQVGPDAKVDQQRFLYELQTAGLTMKKAVLLKAPDEEGLGENAVSSKARAVLGVLMGFTLALLWIVIPEFVRDQKQ
ncbi:teichuronic acid biosynthesis protein TuaF [Peribacillus deserti]|uniref:Teichuronic acid biosynthesis protein TuaF n=1 Tax=Peribacillus deserti TaxID=673318 RepID=A0ABS2QCC5_9BACI|nr:hypothetical protein [Peribacillus deserti]MBM7690813.1 teichuronic acid biosynthesis protein TuaF [Peribacillus deserti]